MGNISIIARRLSDKYVQNGWSGNGGYFKTVGAHLLLEYQTHEMVEYLFGLGQLRNLSSPHGENKYDRNEPTGEPHYVDTTERAIFRHILCVDHGYFYDSDNQWYYICPGPFRIKIPLIMVAFNLDDRGFEQDFLETVQQAVFDRIFDHWYKEDAAFQEHLKSKGISDEKMQEIREKCAASPYQLYTLYDKHPSIWRFFDDWVVIRPAEDGRSIGEILMRTRAEPHVETIYW